MLISPPLLEAYPTAFYDAVQRAGVQLGLEALIDAGDARSYAGSGQTVTDLSGKGLDCWLGKTSGADTNEPTFSGVAGRQSASDYFAFAASASPGVVAAKSKTTWVNSLHKDNATFTLAGWFYATADSGSGASFFQSGDPTDPGIWIYIGQPALGSDNKLGFRKYSNGGASEQVITDAGPTVPFGSWAFVAVSFNEATGALITQVNGTQVTESGKTYSTNATADIAGISLNTSPHTASSSARVASVAGWSRALSAAEMTSLFEASRAKYGV